MLNYDRKKLIEDLKEHEGYAAMAPKSARIGKSKFGSYRDHLGFKTTGIGHLVIDGDIKKYSQFDLDELTEDQAEVILMDDIYKHDRKLQKYFKRSKIDPNTLNSNQLRALVNMTFQMGDLFYAGFKKMTTALKDQDYVTAVKEMKDSLWFKKQTPNRAKKVIAIFNTPVPVKVEEKEEIIVPKKEVRLPVEKKKPSNGFLEIMLELIKGLFKK